MKTTIELPDELLRAAKASAAREGVSLNELFTAALRHHLLRSDQVAPGEEAWRRVFGKADRRDVQAVDEVVVEDLERIDLESWRSAAASTPVDERVRGAEGTAPGSRSPRDALHGPAGRCRR